MKLVDIIPNGYYLLRQSRWERRLPIIFVTGTEEVKTYGMYSTVGTMKQVAYQRVWLSPDGGALVVENSVHYAPPNQISAAITPDAALTMLQTEQSRKEQADYEQQTFNKNVHRFVEAIRAAGFPLGHVGHNQVSFSRSDVVAWVEEVK